MTTVSVEQRLSCRVIGPLELEVDGAALALNGVQARRLLAALVLAEGRPVSDPELADLMWPNGWPENARKALRVLVWRLRTALGAAGERLERTPSGYCFAVPTDHQQFADLVASGLYRLSIRDAIGAIQDLEAALELWRGEPWQDLAGSPAVVGARTRLVELHELALEEVEAARLAFGNPWVALRSLTRLVADSPYRERRWELLALAYLETGQPERAAAELRRFRALLADQLGLDPGPALVALERRLGPPPQAPRPRPAAWRWR
ncbi:AfsR/SARP family transcriptional regulator [Kribbella yunnanensis]|uniref:AfsR/SARP family transcriptional regulator n=1 Tax=Kribbella yunnanensis TaxID=190194 RepID=UPI0031CF352F